MKREAIAVTGMSCNGCEQTVENAIQSVEGVARVDASHQDDTVEVVVEDDVAVGDLHVSIEQAGYDVVA